MIFWWHPKQEILTSTQQWKKYIGTQYAYIIKKNNIKDQNYSFKQNR